MPSRERTLRTEAVVLRHNNWGEADRMLSLYTREAGKVRAIAKGVRKLRSRKAGHLEPFTRVSLLLARGREMWIVTQAETVNAYLPLRENLLKVGYAAYVVELLDRFTYEEGENIPLYNLLVDTLYRLDVEEDLALAVRYYEVRLLDYLGYRPQLTVCARCGEQIRPEDQFFSAAQGGVLCPRCGVGVQGAQPISVGALKYLRHFQRSNWGEASQAHLAPGTMRELENLMHHYLTFLLERGLNSPAFIRRIKRDMRDEENEENEENEQIEG
jgi:DNA repair protein RecO (recombination protein O)